MIQFLHAIATSINLDKNKIKMSSSNVEFFSTVPSSDKTHRRTVKIVRFYESKIDRGAAVCVELGGGGVHGEGGPPAQVVDYLFRSLFQIEV